MLTKQTPTKPAANAVVKPMEVDLTESNGLLHVAFSTPIDLLRITPEQAHLLAFGLSKLATRVQARN